MHALLVITTTYQPWSWWPRPRVRTTFAIPKYSPIITLKSCKMRLCLNVCMYLSYVKCSIINTWIYVCMFLHVYLHDIQACKYACIYTCMCIPARRQPVPWSTVWQHRPSRFAHQHNTRLRIKKKSLIKLNVYLVACMHSHTYIEYLQKIIIYIKLTTHHASCVCWWRGSTCPTSSDTPRPQTLCT